MSNIAFIGLGNMGAPMAANLVKAGHAVRGFDLVDAAKTAAAASGVRIAPSAREAVAEADAIVTMLPAGKHVLSVWTDVLPSMTKGALLIDCSTIDVESAKQVHALAAKHGIASVDAPVSGGTGGAKAATLTFMCGGDEKAFAAALMLKDLRLAQEAAASVGAATPLGAEAAQLYALYVAAERGGDDFSGIINFLRGAAQKP